MGGLLEINDTLKISKERGFPQDLRLEDHVADPENSRRFVGKQFQFWNTGERLYTRPPARVFLVEELPDGKWLYWGNALITAQTIDGEKTSGTYLITKIYSPYFQRQMTIEEAPTGKSHFDEAPTSFVEGKEH